jgi:hypothetical protein
MGEEIKFRRFKVANGRAISTPCSGIVGPLKSISVDSFNGAADQFRVHLKCGNIIEVNEHLFDIPAYRKLRESPEDAMIAIIDFISIAHDEESVVSAISILQKI